MKALSRVIFGFLLLLSSVVLSSPGPVIKDFALIDHLGKFHQLSYYGDQKAVVLYSHSLKFSESKRDIELLVRLQSEYAK